MHRFFKQVSVQNVPEGFAVFLDGRPLKNMADGSKFFLPTFAAAGLIAEEWKALPEEFKPSDFPKTRLMMGAAALKEEERLAVINKIMQAAEADVLCFFARFPTDLVRRQEECWRPLVDRMNAMGCDFEIRQDLSVGGLSDKTQNFLRQKLFQKDNIPLACLQILSGIYDSVILAFFVEDGILTAQEAFRLSCLEELYQNEKWTVDEAALSARSRRESDAVSAAEILKAYEDKEKSGG